MPEVPNRYAVNLAEGKLDDDVSTQAFVEDAYRTVLGREADLSGRLYWQARIDSGDLDRGEFVQHLIWGTEDGSLGDRIYLAEIGNLAMDYAIRKGIWNSVEAASPMDILGDQATSDTAGAMDRIDEIHSDVRSEDIGPIVVVGSLADVDYAMI